VTREETGHPISFADLSAWRKVEVTGADALDWLNDLVSADVGALSPGTSRRSLLLSPTGRIRAEFTAARLDSDRMLLIQDPEQPSPIDGLLDRYTLSSDVTLTDRTAELQLFAFPDLQAPLDGSEGIWLQPSVLGPGLDLITGSPQTVSTTEEIVKLQPDALETARILQGTPRFGVDVTEDDLPQEAGLGSEVSFEKGCYLGQEAVAKVQNLGHPRRVLLRIEAHDEVSAGDAVFSSGQEVGRITSAVRAGGGSVALASVRWAARETRLQTSEGAELRARPLP
jgi:folate-binding protein YgfZ